jgi:hypothetical protein
MDNSMRSLLVCPINGKLSLTSYKEKLY